MQRIAAELALLFYYVQIRRFALDVVSGTNREVGFIYGEEVYR